MNILLDNLPRYLTVNDVRYDVDSDFRTSICVQLLLENSTDSENILLDIFKLYLNLSDEDIYNLLKFDSELIEKLFEEIKWFLSCNECNIESNKEGNRNKDSTSNKIIDFNYDANYIYSAFFSQYNIDLNKIEYLHWWEFKSLLRGLDSSNKIVEIMQFRSVKLSDIKDESQRKYYRKMKKIYEIPVSDEVVKAQNQLEKALLNGDIEAIERLKAGD